MGAAFRGPARRGLRRRRQAPGRQQQQGGQGGAAQQHPAPRRDLDAQAGEDAAGGEADREEGAPQRQGGGPLRRGGDGDGQGRGGDRHREIGRGLDDPPQEQTGHGRGGGHAGGGDGHQHQPGQQGATGADAADHHPGEQPQRGAADFEQRHQQRRDGEIEVEIVLHRRQQRRQLAELRRRGHAGGIDHQDRQPGSARRHDHSVFRTRRSYPGAGEGG
jgi:hypothetical protein